MKMLAQKLSGVAAGVTLSLVVVCDLPARGATLTGTFQVDVNPISGIPLANSAYFGTYSFDSTDFSGTGDISPTKGGLKLTFDFLNLSNASISQTYTEIDDISYSDFPQLSLNGGTIAGLNYLVATSGGTFSFDGSSFFYSVNNSGASGEGTVKYGLPRVSSIPESSPALGLGILGLCGVITYYRKSKKQQNIYRTLP